MGLHDHFVINVHFIWHVVLFYDSMRDIPANPACQIRIGSSQFVHSIYSLVLCPIRIEAPSALIMFDTLIPCLPTPAQAHCPSHDKVSTGRQPIITVLLLHGGVQTTVDDHISQHLQLPPHPATYLSHHLISCS